jgi:hypothetical protein
LTHGVVRCFKRTLSLGRGASAAASALRSLRGLLRRRDHIALAFCGRTNWNVARSIWLSVLRKAGTDGMFHDNKREMDALIRRWGGKGRNMRHLIAGYISKYIGKDADETTFNKKRYWSSKGIPVPEVVSYAHLGPEYGAVDAIDTATAQFYWNDGIGTFWMATGNTV